MKAEVEAVKAAKAAKAAKRAEAAARTKSEILQQHLGHHAKHTGKKTRSLVEAEAVRKVDEQAKVKAGELAARRAKAAQDAKNAKDQAEAARAEKKMQAEA